MKRNFIKARRQRMPAGTRRRFGPYHMRCRPHFHATLPERTIHQADFKLQRRARLNILGAHEKDAAGTDIRGSQQPRGTPGLPGNSPDAQVQAELRPRIRSPLFHRAHRMGRNTRNALGLGPRHPVGRIHDRIRGNHRQFWNQGWSAALGTGPVHTLRWSNSAHRSPLVFTQLALLANTILRGNCSVNSRSGAIVLRHNAKHGSEFDFVPSIQIESFPVNDSNLIWQWPLEVGTQSQCESC